MRFRSVVGCFLSITLSCSAFALPGETRFRVKGKIDELKSAGKMAIVSFQGNTIISGTSGIGSLLSGAVAAKGSGEKPALDQTFMDNCYDLYVGILKSEGYDVLSPEQVVASPAYQAASPVKLPTMLDAKGLKGINTKKKEEVQKIAAELGVDRILFVTSGHGLASKFSMLGDLAGKVSGQATLNVVVFDASGKQLLYMDGSDMSDSTNQQVGGGFQDPQKIIPMLNEADRKLASSFGANISKK